MNLRIGKHDLTLACVLAPVTDHYSPIQCKWLFVALGGPNEEAERAMRVLPFWTSIGDKWMGRKANLPFERVEASWGADVVEVLKGMLELDPHRRLSA